MRLTPPDTRRCFDRLPRRERRCPGPACRYRRASIYARRRGRTLSMISITCDPSMPTAAASTLTPLRCIPTALACPRSLSVDGCIELPAAGTPPRHHGRECTRSQARLDYRDGVANVCAGARRRVAVVTAALQADYSVRAMEFGGVSIHGWSGWRSGRSTAERTSMGTRLARAGQAYPAYRAIAEWAQASYGR